MNQASHLPLADLLEKIAESLDIPVHVHEDAVAKYEEVGRWLEEKDAAIGRRAPLVYPQGSFALGTVTKPIDDNGEYDIDLVYERDLRKAGISQERLKTEAGEHLESFVEFLRESRREAPRLEPGRRCWTLDYPSQFHMDILPAIPDDEGRSRGGYQAETKLLITDKDVRSWQHSNSKGYANWFRKQMEYQFQEKRAALARMSLRAQGTVLNEEMVKAAAEQVPEYKVKTPLQRAIQILKRHRDFYFKGDPDHRPVSIIINTLAAKSYDEEDNLLDALLNLIRRMPTHIEDRYENGRRVAWVENPVNHEENFADRWQDEEFPDREAKFKGWLLQADEDFSRALQLGDISHLLGILGSSLGESVVNKAAADLGITSRPALIKAAQTSSGPALADYTHRRPPLWPMSLNHRVDVGCRIFDEMKGSQSLGQLTDGISVPPNSWLRFQAITDQQLPYVVKWQVVNTGFAALQDNCLRGGFEEGNDETHVGTGNVRWESTKYPGTHWVEAFILKDGICVARSKPFYVRIRST